MMTHDEFRICRSCQDWIRDVPVPSIPTGFCLNKTHPEATRVRTDYDHGCGGWTLRPEREGSAFREADADPSRQRGPQAATSADNALLGVSSLDLAPRLSGCGALSGEPAT